MFLSCPLKSERLATALDVDLYLQFTDAILILVVHIDSDLPSCIPSPNVPMFQVTGARFTKTWIQINADQCGFSESRLRLHGKSHILLDLHLPFVSFEDATLTQCAFTLF